MRWRVERAGSPGHYIPAWIAYRPDGRGVSFTTWSEALDYAMREASHEALAATTGLWKLSARRPVA